MPTTLAEHQFEILPTVDADAGVVFGIGADVSLDENGFRPGGTDWLTQDSENIGRGTTGFGRDVLLGPTWAWDLFVNAEDVPTATAALGRLSTAWRAQAIRDIPGAVLPIRYTLAGRTRRIYGRPRRFDAPPNNRILSGFVPVQADFKCVDAYTYDDAEDSISLSLSATSQGGFVFPAVFPTETLPVGTQVDQAVVGGDAPTHPVFRFFGPVSTPRIVGPGWTLTLNTSIADGQWIEVDTRPWNLGVRRSDGMLLPGILGRRQWLSDIRFEPGRHDLVLDGASGSGGASATVAWRSAWNSI